MNQLSSRCTECNAIFLEDEILQAQSPFIPEFTIYACPKCKAIEHFVSICEAEECSKDVVGGRDGKSFCSKHLDDYVKIRVHFCKYPDILDRELHETFDCEYCGAVWQLKPIEDKSDKTRRWKLVGIQNGEGEE